MSITIDLHIITLQELHMLLFRDIQTTVEHKKNSAALGWIVSTVQIINFGH